MENSAEIHLLLCRSIIISTNTDFSCTRQHSKITWGEAPAHPQLQTFHSVGFRGSFKKNTGLAHLLNFWLILKAYFLCQSMILCQKVQAVRSMGGHKPHNYLTSHHSITESFSLETISKSRAHPFFPGSWVWNCIPNFQAVV